VCANTLPPHVDEHPPSPANQLKPGVGVYRGQARGADGTAGTYGLIDDSRSISQAPFMVVDVERFNSAKACVPLAQLLIEYMGLKAPLLIVTITGASKEAGILALEKVRALLKAAVAEMSHCWFITSGLTDGVAALVAQAVAEHRKQIPGADSRTMPVIGIVSVCIFVDSPPLLPRRARCAACRSDAEHVPCEPYTMPTCNVAACSVQRAACSVQRAACAGCSPSTARVRLVRCC
jgi:hypothetical protein